MKTFGHSFSIGSPGSQNSHPTSGRTMFLDMVRNTAQENHANWTAYLTEKWALSYRHFDHKDTDTNMFVER